MMRIIKQKRLRCMLWALTVPSIMVTVAAGTFGMDIVLGQNTTLRGENQRLVRELDLQKEKILLIEANFKTETGGKENTPPLKQVKEIRESIKRDAGTLEDAIESLNKNFMGVPGIDLVSKLVVLKDTLEATHEELAQKQVEVESLRIETGDNEGEAPLPTRIRKLSDSLKKDTNLKEAVSILTKKLHDVPGTDCVDKVDSLVAELEGAKSVLHILAQKLGSIPGNGVLEKVALLMTEQEVSGEILGEMKETIIDKEEAYNNLYVEFLREKSETNYLGEELSREQIAHLEIRETYNHVMRRQFNS